MKSFTAILCILFLTTSYSFSQGIVRGKITDETGQSIIGAIVTLKANSAVGVTTDLDGNYSLKYPILCPRFSLLLSWGLSKY